jgi:uncharacterized membrane protein YjgN (DUF898 family)
VFFLTGVAIYRGWGYRLARTNWRGIRGAIGTNSWRYGWTYFWTGAVIALAFLVPFGAIMLATAASQTTNPNTILTILFSALVVSVIPALLLVPWRSTKLRRELTNDMQFGSRPFSFTGVAKPLYASFIARWIGVLLLAIVTSGIIVWILGINFIARQMRMPLPGPQRDPSLWSVLAIFAVLAVAWFVYSIITAWYRAVEANYFASQTHYETATFQLDIKGRGLVWIAISNWLILMIGFAIILVGILIAAALTGNTPGQPPSTGALVLAGIFALIGYFVIAAVRPVIQARTLQYFVDHIRLIGPVDASAIAQNEAALSKTGEGLAGAFDVSF